MERYLVGDVPLCIKYHKIFEICREKDALVANCFEEGDWVVDLTRPLTNGELHSWEELMSEPQECCLTHRRDVVTWALDTSHEFNTRSLYRFRTDVGTRLNTHRCIWKCKLPLKIKVILWQVYNRKIQSAVALKKGDGSVVSYAICAGGTKQLTTYFFTVSWLNSFGAVGVRFLA